MREAFLLVGPPGAGKTYIGRLMDRKFGVPFLAYEDIFVKEYERNPNGFLGRAEPLAEKAIFDFLESRKKMCFENTMARKYAHDILKKLRKVSDVRLVYVGAPFETTLARISKRNQRRHVKWSKEELEQIYENCKSLNFDYDLIIENQESCSEEEIAAQLAPFFEERKWFDDHVEILFRGQRLSFKCWSGDFLTDYDMEYQPWRVSFKEENPQYLRHYSLKSGDVVVDAGGYKGTFTAFASKAVGRTGHVISFEPDTKNFEDLRGTLELNGLNNVTLVNKALWSKEAL